MIKKNNKNNNFFFKGIQLDYYKENNIKFKNQSCLILKKKKLKNNLKKKNDKLLFLIEFINKDPIILKYINNLMKKGNKAKAEKIFFFVLNNIKKSRKKENPYFLFKKGLFMLQPYMWLQKIKRFDTNITPNLISFTHNISKSSKILFKYANLRNQEKRIEDKISNELLETLNKKSTAFKKKGEIERSIRDNRINLNWRYD